jgi:hypothetical protein
MTCTEEQISISIRKSSKHIKGIAVHCKRDMRGEGQVLIENVPMSIVVNRHGSER